VALQETVADPEPATLLGVIAPQVKPLGTLSVRLTRPLKWFSPVTVMVELVDTPASTAEGEVAAIVKSWTVNLEVAVWTRGVLAPVIVSV
jgi:hypothetical protein